MITIARAALRLLLPMLGFLILAQGAFAFCSTPAGAAGDLTYSYTANVMVFCDGNNWVSMAGGVSVTVNNTGAGTATPAGSTADVQFNSSGALAADSGKFTYSGGLLSSPNISATGITASSISTTTITASGLGSFGSAFVNGSMTVTGQVGQTSASLSVDSRGVSVTNIFHITGSPISPVGAGGNVILSGTTAVSTSSAGSVTIFSGGAQRAIMNSRGGWTFTPTGVIGLVISPSTGTNAGLQLRAPGDGVSFPFLDLFYGANNKGNLSYDITNDVFVINNQGRATSLNPGGAFVGIGTLSPTSPLYVATNVNGMAAQIVNSNAGGLQGGLLINVASAVNGNWMIGFNRGASSVGTIAYNGSGVTYNATSDRRVKENITDSREGLGQLMSIGVKDFSFKADPSHTIVNGFIAQELNKVYPEAVTTNGDNGEVPLKDKAKIWQVDYGRVTPLIVKAVQDLKHEDDGRDREIDKLKVENGNLHRQILDLTAANVSIIRRLDALEGQGAHR